VRWPYKPTCFVTTFKERSTWTSLMVLFDLLVEFTDIIMMRKCMLGIKWQAERASRQTPEPARAAVASSPRQNEPVPLAANR
jgi:hypothetical protein